MTARLIQRLTPATWLLIISVALGVVLRALLGLGDDGIYWPDEIYQSLEPAHRLVYGYGLVAWEFVEGARNWALPGFVAALLWVARLFGASEPSAYLPFVRAAFILVSAGTAIGIWRLARTLGASEWPAAAGAAVFALAGPLVYFGHRAMAETASALPLVWGLALVLETSRTQRWRILLGASLLGIAVLFRLQNAVFCLGVLGIFAARKDWRRAGETFAVLAAWALFYGLLDKLTWGGWFHSAIKYLQFNLVEGKAAQWGTAPFLWYAEVLFRAMPEVSLALLFGALCAARRAPGLLLTALAFFALHAWTPHKELRFLLPMVPAVCALAAVGVSWVSEALGDVRWLHAGAVVLVAAAAVSGARARRLTFGELGAYEGQKPNASAWGDFADVNRLLLRAHEQPDLCGLKTEAVHQAWTGGQTYLHRDVPYYAHNAAPRQSGFFNYVIAAGGPGEVIAREGRLVLLRIGASCAADPTYSARLP